MKVLWHRIAHYFGWNLGKIDPLRGGFVCSGCGEFVPFEDEEHYQ